MEYFPDILAEYQDIDNNLDLFDFWEKEYLLRQQAREAEIDSALQIRDIGELDFLLRSLYFGRRLEDFWSVLINNLNMHPVLQWLQNSPGWLQEAFLSFLPWYISKYSIEAQKLQFLVSIYNDSYQQSYTAIANVLNLDTCCYLLSRTANNQLRTLLKKREAHLLKEKNKATYGMSLASGKSAIYNTVYGDKVNLIRKVLELMHSSNSCNFHDSYSADRFGLLLQTGEMLFHCGLAEDSLLHLKCTYEDYQRNNRLVESLEDEKIYRQFYKILRRVVPCYALLLQPNSAWNYAQNIYKQFFSRLEADQPSLQYLNIYESIAAGQYNNTRHIALEILYKNIKIKDLRPDEPPLLSIADINSGFDDERLKQLQQLFEQKLPTLPHEAFIIMEMLRLMQLKGYLIFNNKLAKALLSAYMQLWKWIPSKLFINFDIVEQLLAKLDRPARIEAERLLVSLENHNDQKLRTDLLNRPELFRKQSENIRRELFVGKFLGML
ncbi:MAG: hypothetical protein PHE26_11985 [Syntrophomonadaceae bacterium]|nr:hypothetical protein [Syntrophomonadaceae bacterium]